MKAEPPLDPDTHAKVAGAVIKAQRQGRSPAEALHSAGLILSPAKERAIKVATIEWLRGELESWRPAEFMRHKPGGTPKDLYMAILQWIDSHASGMRGQP